MVLRPIDVRNVEEIDAPFRAFAASSNNAGLIVTGSRAANSVRADHYAGGAAPITRHLAIIFWSSTPLTAAGRDLSPYIYRPISTRNRHAQYLVANKN